MIEEKVIIKEMLEWAWQKGYDSASETAVIADKNEVGKQVMIPEADLNGFHYLIERAEKRRQKAEDRRKHEVAEAKARIEDPENNNG